MSIQSSSQISNDNSDNHHNRREKILKLFGKTAGFLDRVCCMSSYQEAQLCGESRNENRNVEYVDGDDSQSSVVWLSEANEYSPRVNGGANSNKKRPIVLDDSSSMNKSGKPNLISNRYNNLNHYRLHLQQQQQQKLQSSPRFPDDFPYYCDFQRQDRPDLDPVVAAQAETKQYPTCASPDRSSIVTATTVTMNTRSPSVVSDSFSAFSSSTVVTHNTQQQSPFKSPHKSPFKKQQPPAVTPSSKFEEAQLTAIARSTRSAPAIFGVSSLTSAYSKDEEQNAENECISPSSLHQRRSHSIRPRKLNSSCNWSMEASKDAAKSIRQIQSESLEQLSYLSQTQGYQC